MPIQITVTDKIFDGGGNAAQGYAIIRWNSFVAMDTATKTIASATNGTVTASTHGYATNDDVFITGNAGGNGTWAITVTSTDVFTLNGAGALGTATGGTSQRFWTVLGASMRVPSTATFSGTITATLLPTSNAASTPGGTAAGYVYTVNYFMSDGSQPSEYWNVGTAGPVNLEQVRTSASAIPTASIVLTQLAQGGGFGTNTSYLAWNGTAWAAYVPLTGTSTLPANLATTASNGTSTFLAREDHVHAGLSTATPVAIGVAAAGTGTAASAFDHVHGFGAPVNNQTGTAYTFVDGDRGKLVTFSNAGAIAVTLPQAGTTTFVANWATFVKNRGVGVVTITPTTSQIDGTATLALASSSRAMIVSDGTNYFTG